MTGTKFRKLYNQLLSDATTTNEIIDGYAAHLQSVIPESTYICGYRIENGCMMRVSYYGAHAVGPEVMPMTVTDVHRHLFGLEDYYLTHVGQLYGMPFMHPNHLALLSEDFSQHYGYDSHLVHLMFFVDGLLKAVLFLVYPVATPPCEDQIHELRFGRDTLEALFYKTIRRKESSAVNHLMQTGEHIIKSSEADVVVNLGRLLNLAFDLSGEADYGSVLFLRDGFWRYGHLIGHASELLKPIHIPGEVYLDRVNQWTHRREVAPNIFLTPLILDLHNAPLDEEFHETIIKIAGYSEPIKETLQLQVHYNGATKAILSLDIAEDSPKSFTNISTQALKRINFLAQLLYTNASMLAKSESMEKLTGLIAKMVDGSYKDETVFLTAYLELLVNTLEEASYASVYIRNQERITFLATIGHDLEALQALDLKPEHFVSVETIDSNKIPFFDADGNVLPVSATLMADILDFAQVTMPKEMYKTYRKAVLPIKDAIISQAPLDEETYMYISCDIKADSPMRFTRESMQLFSALNNLGFSSIANRKLASIARMDSMTGLLNHNTIISQLEAMIHKNESLSIFLFDIDHFKKVNDTFGHQVGDEVLIGISNMLLKDDTIVAGRYGGEEFLLLMPGQSYADATAHAQAILTHIPTMPLLPGQPITISGGLVTRRTGTAVEMIRAADTLLYEAKNNGRNQMIADHC